MADEAYADDVFEEEDDAVEAEQDFTEPGNANAKNEGASAIDVETDDIEQVNNDADAEISGEDPESAEEPADGVAVDSGAAVLVGEEETATAAAATAAGEPSQTAAPPVVDVPEVSTPAPTTSGDVGGPQSEASPLNISSGSAEYVPSPPHCKYGTESPFRASRLRHLQKSLIGAEERAAAASAKAADQAEAAKWLFHCAVQDDVHAVRACLHPDTDVRTIYNDKGLTPCHVAARKGSINVLQYLLRNCESLADLPLSDGGATLFHSAAAGGSIKSISFLIEFIRKKISAEALRSYAAARTTSKGSACWHVTQSKVVIGMLLHAAGKTEKDLAPRKKSTPPPVATAEPESSLPPIGDAAPVGASDMQIPSSPPSRVGSMAPSVAGEDDKDSLFPDDPPEDDPLPDDDAAEAAPAEEEAYDDDFGDD